MSEETTYQRIKIKDVEYIVKYCSLCKTIVLVCLKCENSSCNGGGCDSCYYAFVNSDKYLSVASIPGKFFFKMSLAFHKQVDEILKERHGLYIQIRTLEKELKEIKNG